MLCFKVELDLSAIFLWKAVFFLRHDLMSKAS